mgnify:CR=1 FL=1
MKLPFMRNLQNDTEAYSERYFTSICCLCSIARTSNLVGASSVITRVSDGIAIVSRETMTDTSRVASSLLAWCYLCFRSTPTRATLAQVGVRRQSTLCALHLHRIAAAPYSEDIRQPHRAAGMSSLYIARIHRPCVPRLVDGIACPSLYCVTDWRLFHVKHVGPGGSSPGPTVR